MQKVDLASLQNNYTAVPHALLFSLSHAAILCKIPYWSSHDKKQGVPRFVLFFVQAGQLQLL